MVPPPANLCDERHQTSASKSSPILLIELISMTQFRGQSRLRGTGLTKTCVVPKRSDNTDIISSRATAIGRVLHDVEASIRTH